MLILIAILIAVTWHLYPRQLQCSRLPKGYGPFSIVRQCCWMVMMSVITGQLLVAAAVSDQLGSGPATTSGSQGQASQSSSFDQQHSLQWSYLCEPLGNPIYLAAPTLCYSLKHSCKGALPVLRVCVSDLPCCKLAVGCFMDSAWLFMAGRSAELR